MESRVGQLKYNKSIGITASGLFHLFGRSFLQL